MQAESGSTNLDGPFKFKFSQMLTTRGNLLGWDPSGMRPGLAWSACGACDYRHGAHIARACCALC